MTGFKLHLIDCALIFGAVTAIIFSGFAAFAADCEEMPDEVLRLHILANSDNEEDQQLKYELRDRMLVSFGEVFSDCTDLDSAISAAKEHKEAMESTAQAFIYSKGYDYKVTCEITDTYFTTRCYGNYTLPAGNYTAVRFLIGEAEGQNWWCVMFPPLCLPAAGEFYTDEQSKEIEKSENIEVKFAVFEMLSNIFTPQENDEESETDADNKDVYAEENETATVTEATNEEEYSQDIEDESEKAQSDSEIKSEISKYRENNSIPESDGEIHSASVNSVKTTKKQPSISPFRFMI